MSRRTTPRGGGIATRSVAALPVALLLGIALAGCGPQPAPAQNRSPSAAPPTASPAGPSGSDGAPGPGESSPSAASSGSGALAVDPSLLSVLPITGQGLVQAGDPDTALLVARNPELAANATGLMIATYVPDSTMSSGAPGDDLAVVSVVRLRDPSADDTWFRAWRDSYDAAACGNGGGVAHHSQTDIGSHTVFIGACQGGSFTYHARVSNGAIVVSITSIGPLHLGETVMERLAA